MEGVILGAGRERFLSTFNRSIQLLNLLIKWLVIILLVVMTITVLSQVFFRFVIRQSLPWSEELARYVMIWMVMLAAALGLSRNDHIGVDFFIDRVPKRYARIVRIISYLLIGIFIWLVILWGWRLAFRVGRQRSPAMRISMFYPYFSMPVGGILIMVQLLKLMVNDLLGTGEVEE